MSIFFLMPGHTQVPANILSCTSEEGLVVDVPVVGDTQRGALRLRSSGNPYVLHDFDLSLIGGGNPTGYSSADNFFGSGASLLWKEDTDAADEWRGYIDSIYLVRAEMPFTTGGAGSVLPPSHPRELPDGTLGVVYGFNGNDWAFAKYSHDGTFSYVTTASGGIGILANRQHDFVILPSGRLVAFINLVTTVLSFYSDDGGGAWNALGKTRGFNSALYFMSTEYVPDTDMIVMVRADDDALRDSEVWVSRDGGANFTKVATESPQQGLATCITPDGVVLVATTSGIANLVSVVPIAPGGGFGDAVLTTCSANSVGRTGAPGICTRDDGTIWVFGMNSDANSINMDSNVSRDGGLTWEEPANAILLWDTDFVAAFDGYTHTQFGMWNGKMICVAHSEAATGTSNMQHLLTFGGWDDITDVRRDLTVNINGAPYEHVYLPIDYPDSMGWTRTDIPANPAIVTNLQPGHLNIVGTAVANSGYSSNALFWNGAVGDTRRIRFRCRVNSGGSVADNRSRLRFGINDGGGQNQEVDIRFSTAQVRVLDGPGNILITKGVDMTDWVEFLIAFEHDTVPNTSGLVSIWRRQIDETFWTVVVASGVVVENAGATNLISFGGPLVAGAVDWDISFLAVADDDNGMVDGFTNPDDLAPRSLSASVDYRIEDGINVGGFNGAGVPGDTYTLGTTYSYGKENLWREFRPSRELRSDGANVVWDIIFDAGATDTFHANMVALVGSNFRLANFMMADNVGFALPAVDVDLDSLIESGAGGTGSVGQFVPAVSSTWRKDQLKSSSARKWYLSDRALTRFEIIGNDTDRVYVVGTPANGAWQIFGDRMGDTFTAAHLRYARLRVAAQLTSDGYYKLGTIIHDMRLRLRTEYDHNFTDRTLANVQVHESTAGYRSGSKLGPRRNTLSIQWTPINAMQTDWARQVADFYNAVESSTKPFIFWRDSTNQQTIQLVRMLGTYASPNQRGELGTALAAIDQLVLEEEL